MRVLALILLCSVVQAKPIAEARNDLGIVTLYDEQGQCVGEARRAEWMSADGRDRVPGCWVARSGGLITISYWDGDFGRIAAGSFRKVKLT